MSHGYNLRSRRNQQKKFDGTADYHWTHNGDGGRCVRYVYDSREPHGCGGSRADGAGHSTYGHYATTSSFSGCIGGRTSPTYTSELRAINHHYFYPTKAARSVVHGETSRRRISISSSFVVQQMEILRGIQPAVTTTSRRANGSIANGIPSIHATSGGNRIGNFTYVYHHAESSLGPNWRLCAW